MSLQNKFNTFNERIHITRQDTDYKAARDKDDSITQAIKDKFKENGHPVIDDFIQGSLSTFTAIKESGKDFDIDRAIVIDDKDAPADPLLPKQTVLELLEGRGFHHAKIKKPCVTADYKYDDLHIDIPIYSKTSMGSYKLAVGKKNSSDDNKEWSPSAPIELIDWINDSSGYDIYKSEALHQFRRLVRYMKRWRNIQFSDDVCRKIFSIGLTVMFKQHFRSSIDSEGFPNDLQALKRTIDSIFDWSNYFQSENSEQWRIHVDLPVTPYRNIFHGSSLNTGTQFRNKLSSLRSTLQKVVDETDEVKQCELLRGVFGTDFPECSKSASSSIARKAVYATSGAVGTSQGA